MPRFYSMAHRQIIINKIPSCSDFILRIVNVNNVYTFKVIFPEGMKMRIINRNVMSHFFKHNRYDLCALLKSTIIVWYATGAGNCNFHVEYGVWNMECET